MESITVGADPEFFLTNNSHVVSAIDRIGGSKRDPRPYYRDKFFVQEDNVAVEFNIPPASTAKEFAESINWVITKMAEDLKPHGLHPHIVASALFPDTELEDARAKMFGCDPDFNAWLGIRNPRPYSDQLNLRSAGGHIHVGNMKVPAVPMIRAMDLFLGVPAVLMDKDTDRKKLYGKAGAYRKQSYGVEYRVLSNFWIQSKELSEWAFNQTMHAHNWLVANGLDVINELGDLIQECINTNNPDLAVAMMDDVSSRGMRVSALA